MIAWTADAPWAEDDPARGEIVVVPYPDRSRRSDLYQNTVGACDMVVHELPLRRRVAHLAAQFITIVVADKIDVQKAHKAFLEIDEYHAIISTDTPGWDEEKADLIADEIDADEAAN